MCVLNGIKFHDLIRFESKEAISLYSKDTYEENNCWQIPTENNRVGCYYLAGKKKDVAFCAKLISGGVFSQIKF